MTGNSSYDQLVQEDRVHRRVYADPQIYDDEMRRIFGRTWVFVGHESEVPEPGDFKTDTLGRRPIILVRGEDRKVRVLYNTCRHRGSKVAYEDYGNAEQFRCLYHGWTYETTGMLKGVPLRERFRNFDPEPDFGLIPVPRTQSHRGFVFASLSREGPSLEEHLGRGAYYLDQMCDRAPDGAIEAIRPIKCDYRGNWKLQLENYADNYHAAILHQSAFEVGAKMQQEKFGTRPFTMRNAVSKHIERNYGAGHSMVDYVGNRGPLWMNAYANPEYLKLMQAKYGPERAQDLLELDVHIMIYPNLLLHTRMNHYRVLRPTAVDRTEVWSYPCKLKGAPRDVNDTLILNTAHHVSSMGEVQVDDLQAFTWVQDGLQVEDMDWVLFKLVGENVHVNEHGEREWHNTSEEMIRHEYVEWRRLMVGEKAQGSRPRQAEIGPIARPRSSATQKEGRR